MKLNIGETIKKLRKEREITQEEFAEVLGVSCQSVSRWENSSCYPDIELIPTIASFFGISTDKLMGIDEITEKENIEKYAETVCADPDTGAYPNTVKQQIDDSIEAVVAQLDYQMMEQCEALDGYWQPAYWGGVSRNDDVLLDAFYNNAFGGNRGDAQMIHGKCVENTTRVQCLANNSGESVRAKYDANTDTCTFTEEWYREKCQGIGGYYEGATCYIGQSSIKESNKKVTGEQ